MKRSEMIEIIAFNIAYQALSSGNANADISWISVDDLLNEIESQGMLPPFEDRNYNELGDNFVVLGLDQGRYTGTCKWEPEDD